MCNTFHQELLSLRPYYSPFESHESTKKKSWILMLSKSFLQQIFSVVHTKWAKHFQNFILNKIFLKLRLEMFCMKFSHSFHLQNILAVPLIPFMPTLIKILGPPFPSSQKNCSPFICMGKPGVWKKNRQTLTGILNASIH